MTWRSGMEQRNLILLFTKTLALGRKMPSSAIRTRWSILKEPRVLSFDSVLFSASFANGVCASSDILFSVSFSSFWSSPSADVCSVENLHSFFTASNLHLQPLSDGLLSSSKEYTSGDRKQESEPDQEQKQNTYFQMSTVLTVLCRLQYMMLNWMLSVKSVLGYLTESLIHCWTCYLSFSMS